jgi:hypothetical protein
MAFAHRQFQVSHSLLPLFLAKCLPRKISGNSVKEALLLIDRNTVFSSITIFETALMARKDDSISNILTATKTCGQVIHVLEKKPRAMSTAISLSHFWTAFNQIWGKVQINEADAITMRAWIMTLHLKVHEWLENIAWSSCNTNRTEKTWAISLADEVSKALTTQPRNSNQLTLNSMKFLPKLPQSTFSTNLPRYTRDHDSNLQHTVRIVSQAIRRWLGFPMGSQHIIRATLLQHLLSRNNKAVLYLQPVWAIFSDPLPHVFQGASTRQLNQLSFVEGVLKDFGEQWQKHKIFDYTQPICREFEHLQEIIHEWMEAPLAIEEPVIQESDIQEPDIQEPDFITAIIPMELPLEPQMSNLIISNGHSKMIVYLQALKPIAEMGIESQVSSGIPLLRAVALRPDKLLPFRQLAPAMRGAMSTIYSEPDRLQTRAGLFNALCFRGMFYGSEWASTHLQWFESYHAWDQYRANWDGPEASFINKTCYGICQAGRDLCHALNYWQGSLDWPKFLGQSRGKGELNRLFKYLRAFDNIGDLSALLLLGDLVEGNVLDMPDAFEWGEIVANVKKGAAKGLDKLGLLPPKSKASDIQHAFVALHEHIMANVSMEDRTVMGYNVIMLEHALCKRNRVSKYLV